MSLDIDPGNFWWHREAKSLAFPTVETSNTDSVYKGTQMRSTSDQFGGTTQELRSYQPKWGQLGSGKPSGDLTVSPHYVHGECEARFPPQTSRLCHGLGEEETQYPFVLRGPTTSKGLTVILKWEQFWKIRKKKDFFFFLNIYASCGLFYFFSAFL